MNKDLKVVLFSLLCTMTLFLVFVGLAEGKDLLQILISIGQIFFMLFSIVGSVLFFLWLGTKIFHD